MGIEAEVKKGSGIYEEIVWEKSVLVFRLGSIKMF